MLRGRVIKIWSHNSFVPSMSGAFYVGIEHEDTAINALLKIHPEYEGLVIDATERLSSTATSYLEMAEGEVRDRAAV